MMDLDTRYNKCVIESKRRINSFETHEKQSSKRTMEITEGKRERGRKKKS